ncbi:MAG TPA: TonB family protein [Polyangiaceae bacterium]|nr:TonB family protein [Polyangiaceae bacterium]
MHARDLWPFAALAAGCINHGPPIASEPGGVSPIAATASPQASGGQASLPPVSSNAVAAPYAAYLNDMHQRIHPIFADLFLESLYARPANDPLNDQNLVTLLEIVLTKDGHLKKIGVVRTSGVTAFDVAAIDAVDRAQPFGSAPSEIVSTDGNVYVRWEFHRNEVYACSTFGARPFLLTGTP